MPEQAIRTLTVDAPPQVCFDVVTQVERYAEWIPEVKQVDVLTRGDDNMPGSVFFRVGAMGRSISYTLQYYYGTNPLRVAWRLIEGNLTRILSGEYVFQLNSQNGTELLYRLEVDLLAKLPGFVTRRAEQRIIDSAVNKLRSRAEHQAALA